MGAAALRREILESLENLRRLRERYGDASPLAVLLMEESAKLLGQMLMEIDQGRLDVPELEVSGNLAPLAGDREYAHVVREAVGAE